MDERPTWKNQQRIKATQQSIQLSDYSIKNKKTPKDMSFGVLHLSKDRNLIQSP